MNSRIELGSRVLDLMRIHCDRPDQAAGGVEPARGRFLAAAQGGPPAGV